MLVKKKSHKIYAYIYAYFILNSLIYELFATNLKGLEALTEVE